MATKQDVLGNHFSAPLDIGAGRWRRPEPEPEPSRVASAAADPELQKMIDQAYRGGSAKPEKRDTNPLASLLEEARTALPYDTHYTPGIDDPKFRAKKAAAMRTLVLNSSPLPSLFGPDGRIARDPRFNDAGQTIMLDTAIAKMSRCIEAGAQLIVLPEPGAPRSDGDLVLIPNNPSEFVSIDPAPFSLVADDTDTPETALPVKTAPIDRYGQQFGVRFRVNRHTQSLRGAEQVAAEAMISITAGIAQTADMVLLRAIRDAIIAAHAPASPPWYSPARAAAAGLRFTDLRGIVGTADVELAITGDGELVLNNVSAELSPAIAESIIGDFHRAAVVLHPEVTVLAERLNAVGDLVVQAWINISAAVPDPRFFFVWGNPA